LLACYQPPALFARYLVYRKFRTKASSKVNAMATMNSKLEKIAARSWLFSATTKLRVIRNTHWHMNAKPTKRRLDQLLEKDLFDNIESKDNQYISI
jgi:hypothetical protein